MRALSLVDDLFQPAAKDLNMMKTPIEQGRETEREVWILYPHLALLLGSGHCLGNDDDRAHPHVGDEALVGQAGIVPRGGDGFEHERLL